MDAIIKNKISRRQECNKELLRIFTEIVDKNPDLRFGQILFNFQFVKWEDVNKRIKILDPFYEESVDTLNRVKHLIGEL
jgi:hypothetical protein